MHPPTFLQCFDSLASRVEHLERDKPKGYDDLSDSHEARALLGMARESYDRGNLEKSWFEIDHVESVLFFWRQTRDQWVRLQPDIRDTMRHTVA
jgi:hypothetical protein